MFILITSLVFPFLQVFLYDQEEFPMVRDLGFAIAPGLRAIVAATYTQVYIKTSPRNCLIVNYFYMTVWYFTSGRYIDQSI